MPVLGLHPNPSKTSMGEIAVNFPFFLHYFPVLPVSTARPTRKSNVNNGWERAEETDPDVLRGRHLGHPVG